MLRINLWLLYIFLDKDHKMYTSSCFHPRQKVVALQERMQKTQVWIVVEATTFCSNFVVFACVMNQSEGHWLLSNTSTTTIALIINMEATLLLFLVGLKFLSHLRMRFLLCRKICGQRLLRLSNLFCSFWRTFDEGQVNEDGHHVGSMLQVFSVVENLLGLL